MNAIAIVGNSLDEVSKAVISQIEVSSSFELENFVVVPDRFSLLAEKLVFEQLGISSSFNIKVLGISRLAAYFSSEEKVLSQNESKLLVYEILRGGNFKFFKPTIELSTELFNIISQIKSSNISAIEFEKNSQTEKQKEIARVFVEYENAKEFPDQSDVLTNLSNNISFEKVKNCSFFFAGFDSLTAQGESILEKLILFSKRVVVGATHPSNQKNALIYDLDILNKLSRISRKNKVEIKKIYLKNNSNLLSSHILENSFAFSPKILETNKVHLLEFETPEKEIQEIAKTVLFYVKTKNKRFSDFNIMLGNLEETSQIFERVFEQYNIPIFLDTSKKISTLPIHTFFVSLFSCLNSKNEKDFFNLVLNPYVALPSEEISSLRNLVILNDEFKEEFANNFENIKKIIEIINYFKKKTQKLNTFSYFSNIIYEIISQFKLIEKNNELIAYFSKNNLKNEKIYLQIFKKIEGTINELSCDFQTSFEEFSNLFLSLFGEKEISAVPISVDCVFAGGEKSFFEKRDVMFVCGASSGKIPLVSKDLGLISDDDISQIKLEVEPTIRMLNRRSKQKILFDIAPREELFVSSSGNELGEKIEKSVIFLELQKIFSYKGKPIQVFGSFFAQFLPYDELLFFNVQSERDFKEELLRLKKQNRISNDEFEESFGKEEIVEEKFSLANELYQNFSPTGIERFFMCPFKHFFTHGLKLKENPKNVFDARDDGNYFHAAAKNFVERNLGRLGNLDEKEIEVELEKIDNIIKNDERFSLLSKNIKNKHVFEMLKKETKMLFESVSREQKFSSFVAKFVEQFFSISLNEKSLLGFVDRVDFCGNFLRVVDYKSGEIKKSLRAVYNGIELQLFIYLIAMQQKFSKDPVCGFYLPIGGDFSKLGLKKFKLEGFILGEQGVLKAIDRRLGSKTESSTVALKLSPKSTADSLVLSTTKNVFSNEGFKAAIEYVKLLISSAEKEILSGEIPAKPIESYVCKNCPFFGICSFKQDEREQQRENGKELSQADFIAIVKGK